MAEDRAIIGRFSVALLRSAPPAIDLIRAHKDEIDIVLLDVTLPGTPSREVFEMTERTWPSAKSDVTSAYSKETVDASFAGQRVDQLYPETIPTW